MTSDRTARAKLPDATRTAVAMAAPAKARGAAPGVPAGRRQPRNSAITLGLLPTLLGYRLRLAQRAVFEDFADTMGGEDISPGLFGILVIIEANPGLKQAELAAAALLDRSSIVSVVDKLEARQLVARRSTPDDRRVNGLWLTAQGSAILRKLKRRVQAHEQRIAASLDAGEREQLFALLARLCQASDR